MDIKCRCNIPVKYCYILVHVRYFKITECHIVLKGFYVVLFCSSFEISCTAYGLTLIIKLIVLEKSKHETAKFAIHVVFMQAYMCILAFTWLGTSPHILHYMGLTRLLITSSLKFSLDHNV